MTEIVALNHLLRMVFQRMKTQTLKMVLKFAPMMGHLLRKENQDRDPGVVMPIKKMDQLLEMTIKMV